MLPWSTNPDREIAGIGNTSFLGGQFFAEIYGLGMEYGAFTMALWCINETDRLRTDFGYIGLPRDFHTRSSFYHTQMMASHMKGEFFFTTSSEAYVRTIGSQSDDEICAMLLNRDQARGFEFDLILSGILRIAEGMKISPAGVIEEHNDDVWVFIG